MDTSTADRPTAAPEGRDEGATDVLVASSAADADAVDAVIGHHRELAAELAGHVAALVAGARAGDGSADGARARLVEFCDRQLLPHAAAEEGSLYPAAATDARATLLVEAMLAEHRVLVGLVDDLRRASDDQSWASSATALRVLFDAHLGKENDLLLPVVAADPSVSVAEVLAGMHELLGRRAGTAGDDDRSAGGAVEAAGAGACSGTCSCGGQDASEAPVLDVREVPHAIRHATVFGAAAAVPPGGSLVLVAPHDPLPLLAQLSEREPGAFAVAYEVRGPGAWRLRLTRAG